MVKKRRLVDLYVVGRLLTIDDDSGQEAITVWLQKPNPVEFELLIRRAGAAKSRVTLQGRDKESELYLNSLSEAADLGDRPMLIDSLISKDVIAFAEARQAEIGAEEEWSKDNYLQGLRDSWDESLQDAYLLGEDDPNYDEAKRVFEELRRFSDAVDEQLVAYTDDLRRSYDDVADSEIEARGASQMVELKAQMAWVAEFRRARVWVCVRDAENHREKYFDTRDEVDLLAETTYQTIDRAIETLMVDPIEGKDLQPTQSSSESSVSQDDMVADQPSGPVVAAQ